MRSLINHSLARDAATTLPRRTTFVVAADFVAQMDVESSACLFVIPKALVNGFVADWTKAFELHPVTNFLRTPLTARKFLLNIFPSLWGDA